MLNILLFLNETCQLPIEGLFEVYIHRLIGAEQIDTLLKIVGTNIISICGLEKDFMNNVIQDNFKEWVEEGYDSKNLEALLPLMNSQTAKKCEEILNMIDCFNICTITYNRKDLLALEKAPSITSFFEDIMISNTALALSSLTISSILKSIHKLRTGKTPKVYSAEQIEVTKELANKMITGGCFNEGFLALMPIAATLERGYIAALLL